MHKLSFFLHAIDTISERIGKIVSFLVIFIIASIFYEIVSRSLFSAPTIWVHELSVFLFGGLSVIGGAYAFRNNAFVNVDIVYSRLPRRWRSILDLLTSALFFIFCVALIWYGWQLAWKSLLLLETNQTVWDPPVYPSKLAIPIAAFILLLQGLAKFIRDLIIAIMDSELL